MKNETLAIVCIGVALGCYAVAKEKPEPKPEPEGSPQAAPIAPEPNPRPTDSIAGTDAAGAIVVVPVWYDTRDEAKQAQANLAREGIDKTVLLIMSGPNCQFCEILKRNLKRPEIAAELEDSYLCVFVDWRDMGFKKRQSIPAFFFMTPENAGQKVAPVYPPTDPKKLLTLLKENR